MQGLYTDSDLFGVEYADSVSSVAKSMEKILFYGGITMTKFKKTAAFLFAAIMMFSAFSMPASAANNQDYKHSYYWDANRELTTYPRLKHDNSGTYFCPQESLPVGGVDFRTQLYSSKNLNFVANTSSYYTVTSRGSYVIRHNRNGKDYEAALQGRYPTSRWKWGSLIIEWSPDYVYDGSYVLN